MRVRFWHIPVLVCTAGLTAMINGHPDLGWWLIILSITSTPFLFGIGLLVTPMPWDDDGFATQGRLTDKYVEDSEALRLAHREGKALWKQFTREQRQGTVLAAALFALTLICMGVMAPEELAGVLLISGFLFALMCHSYRVEVLAHPGRTRSLSRTSVRAIKVIAFMTVILVGVVIAHEYLPPAWEDEIRASIRGWFVFAWLANMIFHRPARAEG